MEVTRRRGGHRAALITLVALPFLVFVGPALAGHVMAPGDDLTQNLPLRILAGADVRHLHLPLWDPFIWSGTPLLAGFNGGALYPTTMLFSFLPATIAWGLGEAVTYAVAGTGVYRLVRRLGPGPLPAWLSGFVFTWSGFMMAQLRHLGLIQGLCWVGWILLGLDQLARPAPGPRRRREVLGWAALTGMAAGFTALAGDPRSVSDVAVAAVLFWLWSLWRHPEGRRRLLVGSLGAGFVAAMVAAGQYLPGLAAEASSQRAVVSMSAFGAGSLRPAQLLFGVFPFLSGGFDSLGLAPYSATYNLPEISGYLGVTAVAGALALALEFLARRRRATPHPSAAFWVLLILVGVVLAFGQYTPLAHVLLHVPLYNGERLQSRNLGEVDLGLAVLLGLWAERFLALRGRSSWPHRVAGLVPFLTVAVLTVLAWAWPNGMAGLVETPSQLLPAVWPFIGAALGLGALVAALFWWGPTWSRRRRSIALVALIVVDLGFFVANAATGWLSSTELSALRSRPAPLADLSPGGRYAVFDPGLFYPGYIQAGSGLVPVPDLNLVSDTPSIQGYGSLVAGSYEDATGTHDQGSLNESVITTSLGRRLDLELVLLDPHEDLSALVVDLLDAHWTRLADVSGLQVWKAPYRPVLAKVSGGGGVSCVPPRSTGGGTTCTLTTTGPVHLVRSEAYQPGWAAFIGREGAPLHQVGVVNDDLLQAVDLPGPGHWVVEFHYRPRRAFTGLVLSLLGLAVGLLGSFGLVRRVRRPSPPPG